MKHFFSSSRLLSFLSSFALLVSPLFADTKPNFIVILADDLGWGDISCQGATKIQTPNIDRLAREGARFTDAHSPASVCSPSRYGVMTGLSPWRLHRTGNGYKLKKDRLNIASMLEAQGYRSAAIGKWHLGYGKDWNQKRITGPLEVGFNYHFGVPGNHNDQYRVFIENHDIFGRKPGEAYRVVNDGRDLPEGVSQPRVEDQVDTTLTAKAVGFIREQKDQPFFLYFTPCASHTHITPAAKFRGTSQAGLLGDYIQELDAHVGDLLATLDELKLSERTLVIFSSDNGGTPNDFKGSQKMNLNLASEAGGVREKFHTAKQDARAMGHFTNGPWHDGKGSPYEGGHRVPFIARWPGQIPAASTSEQTICLTDLLATFASIVGAKLPDDAGEDSFDILPALRDPSLATPIRPITILQADTKDDVLAVRSGRWKFTESKNGKKKTLYDLTQDVGETKDIAAEHPEVVKQLSAQLAQAREAGRTRK
ncbi:MAG TPA: arylsulfatase [Verrucomicrobiales bacterium]|nr:arylsulfatase [Verrucomicrobiales bacterium]